MKPVSLEDCKKSARKRKRSEKGGGSKQEEVAVEEIIEHVGEGEVEAMTEKKEVRTQTRAHKYLSTTITPNTITITTTTAVTIITTINTTTTSTTITTTTNTTNTNILLDQRESNG
jgi:hypothetical protein